MFTCTACNEEITFLDFYYIQKCGGTFDLENEDHEYDDDTEIIEENTYRCPECGREVDRDLILATQQTQEQQSATTTVSNTVGVSPDAFIPAPINWETHDWGIPTKKPSFDEEVIQRVQRMLQKGVSRGAINPALLEAYDKIMEAQATTLNENPISPMGPKYAQDESKMEGSTPVHILCAKCNLPIILECDQWRKDYNDNGEEVVILHYPAECAMCQTINSGTFKSPIKLKAYY